MFGSSLRVAMTSAQPEPAYVAQGVRFSGDQLRRVGDLVGNTNGKLGIFSVWLKRFETGGFTHFNEAGGSNDFYVKGEGDNTYTIASTTGSPDMNFGTATALTDTASWHHLLGSWDRGLGNFHMYLDGADDLSFTSNSDVDIDYTRGGHELAARWNEAPATKLNAEIADMYINYKEFLDFSVLANRLKFRSLTGKPVFLGDNGELPTGTAPIIFYSGDAAVWNSGLNKGTGGNFVMGGAVTDATSSPS